MPEPHLGALVSRFATAGVANTLVGGAVILALDLGLGLPPAVANAGGYLVGFLLSWVLHRRFVFRATDAGWAIKARYLLATACAYGTNQTVLHLVLAVAGEAPMARLAAQVAAIGIYTLLQFLLLRSWVFRTATR